MIIIFNFYACSSNPQDCDPRIELGLLSKAGCKLSGAYDDRIQIREKELKQVKDLNKDLSDEEKIVLNQNKIVKKNLALKSAQLDKLNKRLAFLKKNNTKSKDLNSEQEEEIRMLEADIEKLKEIISL